MLKANHYKITLNFKNPSGTSRGILTTKDSWIVELWDDSRPEIKGLGEASIIKTLSPEWSENYELELDKFCKQVNNLNWEELNAFPSIKFAFETAKLNLENGESQVYFPSNFAKGKEAILINGLIWMGNKDFMLKQIRDKIEKGFSCIKMKIGAIDFETELDLIRSIRSKYSKEQIELRVDANGAFNPTEALSKLEKLAQFDLHSIEQPIKAGQWTEMKELCKQTPLSIALDEELIEITDTVQQKEMLSLIDPQYIILKPSLLGGFKNTDKWIQHAKELNINWWVTSALESNIGLSAIAQYTFTKNNPLPQGLGTGQLYTNNIPSKLKLKGDKLWM